MNVLKTIALHIKWWHTRQQKIKEASLRSRTPKELLGMRDSLYKRYLEADRMEAVTEAHDFKSKLEAIDYCLGKRSLL